MPKWENHYRSGLTVKSGYVSSCCDMWHERKSNYCPHCGAKMDEKQKMPEVKPCPFCGAKPILDKNENYNGETIYQVYCPSSVVRVETTWFDNEEAAIEAWNRRTNDRKRGNL